jgi:multicomponent Na+:H+ antiporter subunit A
VPALAGIAMLLAHGMFKAALFLTVGAVDHATGTRDVRTLSGVGRALPGLAIAATLAAASMAGLPPLVGFVGKEAAFEGFLHGGAADTAVEIGLVLGATLTAAYSARLLWGAFARKPDRDATPVRRPGPALTLPVWLCAVAGLVLGFASPLTDALGASYAAPYPEDPGYHLALWHGLGLPLLLSAVALGGGLALHAARARLAPLAGRSPLDAQRAYEKTIAGIGRVAVGVTGRLQVGSLPAYLATILVTFVLLPGVATVLAGAWPTSVPLYHEAIQVPLAIVVVIAALAVTRARRRFTAVLLVGVIGYGVGGLFIADGAPDLALAQFLVETLSLVAFVFVLRRLPPHFTEERPSRRVRLPKSLLGAAAGLAVAVFAVVLSAARTEPASTSAELARLAPEAGATNVISAILVDFRALDTVGEIGVLFVAASGVASLVLATRYDRQRREAPAPRREEDVVG